MIKTISRKLVADLMMACDLVIVAGTSVISFLVCMDGILPSALPPDIFPAVAGLASLGHLVLARHLGVYRLESLVEIGNTILQSLKALVMLFICGVMAAFFTKSTESWPRIWAICWFILASGGLTAIRLALSVCITWWRRKGAWQERIILVGSARQREQVSREIAGSEGQDREIVGCFDDRRLLNEVAPENVLEPGDFDALAAMTRRLQVTCIVLAMTWDDEARIRQLNKKLSILPVDVHIAFPTRSLHHEFLGFTNIYGQSLIRIGNRPLNDRQVLLKRLEDLLLTSLLMLVAAPIMLMVALAIRIDSPGPILFRQPRHGFNDTIFTIYKFRTMHDELGDPNGAAATRRNDPRVTRMGRLLRRWSLDELPQLLNVLKGDMSLIGPRAHPVEMFAEGASYREIVENYAARHRVKPGITGWAQVKGNRGRVDSVEKARKRIDLDMEYISNWSLTFDAYILLLTPVIVLGGEEAY